MSQFSEKSHTAALLRFFVSQPGIFISIAYLCLTACGIIYSHHFYKIFDIPILKLSNITDLLIAGIADPAAYIMFAGAVAVAMGLDFIFLYSERQQSIWRKRPQSAKRTLMLIINYVPKSTLSVMIPILMLFALYVFVLVGGYADWRGEQVKEGDGTQILLRTEQHQEGKPLMLLGSTQNYVITYDMETSNAKVYPVDGIISIQPQMAEPDKEDTEQAPGD